MYTISQGLLNLGDLPACATHLGRVVRWNCYDLATSTFRLAAQDCEKARPSYIIGRFGKARFAYASYIQIFMFRPFWIPTPSGVGGKKAADRQESLSDFSIVHFLDMPLKLCYNTKHENGDICKTQTEYNSRAVCTIACYSTGISRCSQLCQSIFF